MAGNFIRWPEGNYLDVVKQKFQRLSNMPNVIGAIDGCDISIEAPKAKKHFNSVLSRTRQVIERCFALLKGRFRRLKHLDMKRIDLIPSFILACCVLHNICLHGLEENHLEEDNVDDFIEEGFQNVRRLVRENNDDDDDDIGLQQEGEAKRAYLVHIFERNNL